MPTKLPFASYMDRPRSSIVRLASPVGAAKRMSIVLNIVPASEPMAAFEANIARTPTVSSTETPYCAATVPDCLSAIAKSDTSPTALFAPAASRSATCAA